MREVSIGSSSPSVKSCLVRLLATEMTSNPSLSRARSLVTISSSFTEVLRHDGHARLLGEGIDQARIRVDRVREKGQSRILGTGGVRSQQGAAHGKSRSAHRLQH